MESMSNSADCSVALLFFIEKKRDILDPTDSQLLETYSHDGSRAYSINDQWGVWTDRQQQAIPSAPT